MVLYYVKTDKRDYDYDFMSGIKASIGMGLNQIERTDRSQDQTQDRTRVNNDKHN